MDFCAAIPSAVALMYYIPQTTPFCNCFDASQFPSQFRYVNSVISFDMYVYVIGARANPPVPTQECGSR